MVKEIEKLRPEIQPHTLPERYQEVLDGREIRVYETRAGDRRPGRVPKFSVGRVDETGGVEPLADTRIAHLGVTDLVGAVDAVAVVLEIYSRVVAARKQEKRESGSGFFDHSHFPISQDRVDRTAPGASEPLALAGRQFVDQAGGEIMIEIDLRQAPIQLLPPG